MDKKIPNKYKFIVLLGKALHTCGVPSYKIQNYLSEIARNKGLEGSFMDTPTWINYVFYEEDEHTYNYIECVPPGGLDLGALSRVTEITGQVLNREITDDEAVDKISKSKHQNKSYDLFLDALTFIVSGGAFCVILKTNWVTAFAASILGLLVFLVSLLASKSAYIRSTLESMVAFVSTIGAGVLSVFFPEINISLAVLSSIIIFIPGLAITTAIEEITSKNLVSGTAKLGGALVSLFKQFFGVILGVSILPFFIEIKNVPLVSDIPLWVDPIAFTFMSLGLVFSLRIRYKDMIYAIITAFISYYTTILMDFSGLFISIFVGTIVVVFFSSLFNRISGGPKLVFLIPGIIVLVPGSKAFIGLSTIFLQTHSGLNYNMGEQVSYILMGIIGGLIFSGSFMNKKNIRIKETGKL
ncbi:MAG: threonine/serine exporter family protein [Bacteroidales bacterium]|nr:threonine/serine exporter family protein [Bacteroidales bacterium]